MADLETTGLDIIIIDLDGTKVQALRPPTFLKKILSDFFPEDQMITKDHSKNANSNLEE